MFSNHIKLVCSSFALYLMYQKKYLENVIQDNHSALKLYGTALLKKVMKIYHQFIVNISISNSKSNVHS